MTQKEFDAAAKSGELYSVITAVNEVSFREIEMEVRYGRRRRKNKEG